MSEQATAKNDNTDTFDDPDVKLIILGDSAVGKSKLVERFLESDFNPRRMSTHAVNIFRKNVVDNDGKTIRGDIWDTAGQDKFASMHPSYYYKADACILVFDTTRKETYVNLTKWYTELRRNCPKIPCIVVANKIDINYMVTQKRFKFANKHSLPFFFCSSADGTNVVKVFNDVIMAGLQNKKHAAKDFVDECLEAFDTLFEDEEKGQSEN